VAADKPQFPPGSRFSYSDTGFLLLGLMIERVSGQSYGDYLQSHIFGPAQMTNTALDPAPARAVGMTAMPTPPEGLVMRGAEAGPAKGSAAGGDGPMLLRPAPGTLPPSGALRVADEAALHGSSAGGSFSTAGDMQKFFAALSQGKLTSVATMKMLVSAQIVAAKAQGAQPEHDYGFGFGVGRIDGHRWWGHNGGAPGVNAEATVFPDNQLSIVVLANRDPPAATMLFHELRTALFDPAKRQMCGLP
jgi:CubicO group peptidase (beta-lactamase class C family)